MHKFKYHDVMMLLLRPTSTIAKPSIALLKLYYERAVMSICLHKEWYKADLLTCN